MQVILFRHGIAMERDDAQARGIKDDDRTLTKEGVEKTREAVAGLRYLLDKPNLILSSPLPRAQQTADILASAFKSAARAECKPLAPGGAPDKVAEFLLQRMVKEKKKLEAAILVGHEPDLSKWAAWAITGRVTPLFELKKAGACCIEFDAGPRAAKGVLQWLIEAGQLRKLS